MLGGLTFAQAGAATGTSAHACSLVTKNEAGAILGKQRRRAEPTGGEGQDHTEARAQLEHMRATVSGMGGPALKDGSVQFKTDTSVTGGSWDEAAVLSGFTFAAVKKDVFMKIDTRFLGETKVKALVAKAMSRI